MQTRRLKPNENLIFHLIKSQSSTHDSALRELVQNAYDAGATSCHLTLTSQGFSVADDGRGFTSEQEIEQCFETFGTPHAEDKTEQFGRFRMGRCQIMAFAPTTWQSNEFQMEVDFKARGLDYELLVDQMSVSGCRISGTWYQPLPPYRVEQLTNELRECFEFFYRLPLYVNGERFSRPLEALTITAETEEFYIIEDPQRSGVEVYNLGIHVGPLEMHHCRWYLRGVLLSKQHLPLDISRRHWLWRGTACWERLDKFLRQRFPVVLGRGKLSRHQVQSVLHALRRQETTIDAIRSLKLFHDPQRSRFWTLHELSFQPFTFAGDGDDAFLADKINQLGAVRVLSATAMWEVFGGATLAQGVQRFFAVLRRQAPHPDEPDCDGNHPSQDLVNELETGYVPFEEVVADFQEDCAFVAEQQLTTQELCALKALRKASERVLGKLHRYPALRWVDAGRRRVEAGFSLDAAAWTDGHSFIAIHQPLLGLLRQGIRGADYLAAVLVHEWCHQASNPGEHDAEFYRNYHNLILHPETALLTTLAVEINGNYGRYLRQAGLPVPVHVQRHLTGRAALSDRQQKHYQELLVQYSLLHQQFLALLRHFFALFQHAAIPGQPPTVPVKDLLASHSIQRAADQASLVRADYDDSPLRSDVNWITLQDHADRDFWYRVRGLVSQAGYVLTSWRRASRRRLTTRQQGGRQKEDNLENKADQVAGQQL